MIALAVQADMLNQKDFAKILRSSLFREVFLQIGKESISHLYIRELSSCVLVRGSDCVVIFPARRVLPRIVQHTVPLIQCMEVG